MVHHNPSTAVSRRIHPTLVKPLLALLILALIPLALRAQTGAPPHATPAATAPNPVQPPPGAPPGAPPAAPAQPGAIVPAPTPRLAPPPTLPGAGQPVTPGAGQPMSPATAPQLLYEGAPTTQSVRRTGGSMPDKGSETLPSSEPSQPRIDTLMKNGATIDDIFKSIRDKTGVQIKAIGPVQGKVIPRIQVRDQPVEAVLDTLANQNQWVWVQMSDGTYEMMDQPTYNQFRSQKTQIKVFQLHFIDAEELLKVVQPLLTPEIGAVAADARSNKLIVTDLPGKLGLVGSIIREYDVQIYTHVFEIKNVSMDTIKEQLDAIKSKAGEMFVDNLNRVIIVKDTFDKIKQMDQLVQIVDRDVETKVYNLTNIGPDNDFADDLVTDFLEPLKSKDDAAVMKYNKNNGKLYVRDIRSVQEKVLQTLRKMDTPRKQVRIEGEILSVAVTHDLNLSANWKLSHNLPDAFKNPLTGFSSETAFNTKGLPAVTVSKDGLSFVDLTDDIQVQLNAALTDSRTRLLLRPRITIANNETGTIQITRNEPVLQTYNYGYNSTGSNAFNGGASSGQQTYETGLALMIKPAISNRGLIEIQVQIQNTTPIIVDNIGGGVRGVGSSGETAQTMLIIPSGETRVIGGLISRDITEGQSGVPILSELPWVGWLFGQKTKNNSMRNLMFFITPTILEEQPLNDLVVEAVNPLAEVDMKSATTAAAPAAQIGDIPPELRPYLKEILPEPLPLPEGSLTSGTVPRVRPESGLTSGTTPQGEVIDENADSTATAAAGAGSRFLTNAPYIESNAVPGEFRVGGAVPQEGQGKGTPGPSGLFGGGAAAPAGARGGVAARPVAPPAGGRGATARPTPRPSTSRSGGRSPYSSQGLRGGSSSGMGFRNETNY